MEMMLLTGILAVLSGGALLLVPDPADLAQRAARTAVQVGFVAALGAVATPDIALGLVPNLLLPMATAAATVIHGAFQPPVVIVDDHAA